MNEGMSALKKNQTWEAIDRPQDKMAIGYNLVYNVKYRFDGTFGKYRCC